LIEKRNDPQDKRQVKKVKVKKSEEEREHEINNGTFGGSRKCGTFRHPHHDYENENGKAIQ
jgi:hypothetical protein